MARSGSSSYQMSASRMSGGKLRRGVHRGKSPVVADLLLDQTDPSPLSPLPSFSLLPRAPIKLSGAALVFHLVPTRPKQLNGLRLACAVRVLLVGGCKSPGPEQAKPLAA